MSGMSKFKPYLEYLENADKIESFAREIVDLELELDKLEEQKSKRDNILNGLELELKGLKTQLSEENDSEKVENLKAIIDNKKHEITLEMVESRPLVDEINKREIELFSLQESRKEAIRRGMADLFHQAKEDYDQARMEWIKYSEMSLKAHEKVKKRKKEMDAVKSAFKAEFDDDK
jgi:hypothetical protein